MRVYVTLPVEERFWRRVRKTAKCWLWFGAKSRNGYGHIQVGTKGSPTVSAHRFSWELSNGPIPAGYYVCHGCDEKSCVNPAHLFLGTPLDNMKDMWRKGRHGIQRGEERGRVAKLKARDVLVIRASDLSNAELARRYGMAPSSISQIRSRRRWRHL